MGIFSGSKVLVAELRIEIAELRDDRRRLQAENRELVAQILAVTKPAALIIARQSPPPGGDPEVDADATSGPRVLGPTEAPDAPPRRMFFPGRDRRPRPEMRARPVPERVVPGEVEST